MLGGAAFEGKGLAGVELMLGREGVGCAVVLTTAVLGEGAPAELLRPAILGLLVLRERGVEEEAGEREPGWAPAPGAACDSCFIGLGVGPPGRAWALFGGVELSPGRGGAELRLDKLLLRSAVAGPSRVGKSARRRSSGRGKSSM